MNRFFCMMVVAMTTLFAANTHGQEPVTEACLLFDQAVASAPACLVTPQDLAEWLGAKAGQALVVLTTDSKAERSPSEDPSRIPPPLVGPVAWDPIRLARKKSLMQVDLRIERLNPAQQTTATTSTRLIATEE